MPNTSKRTLVDILPEWENDLDRLKREVYYNTSKAEMLRSMIALGVKMSIANLDTAEGKQPDKNTA